MGLYGNSIQNIFVNRMKENYVAIIRIKCILKYSLKVVHTTFLLNTVCNKHQFYQLEVN